MDRHRHPRLERLRERRRRHRQRRRSVRAGVALVGFLLFVGGIALIPLPGPGTAVTLLGLALLALEFAWAEWALGQALLGVDRANEVQKRLPRVVRALLVVASTALAAFALWWTLSLLGWL